MRDHEKKPMTLKRVLHGIFNWQTLLVLSAFMGFFVFAGYICGNISAPYRIADTSSAEYKASETGFLIFFIVGSVLSLFVALFAAYMCDHPQFLKEKFAKKTRAESVRAEGSSGEEVLSPFVAAAGDEEGGAPEAERLLENTDQNDRESKPQSNAGDEGAATDGSSEKRADLDKT